MGGYRSIEERYVTIEHTYVAYPRPEQKAEQALEDIQEHTLKDRATAGNDIQRQS